MSKRQTSFTIYITVETQGISEELENIYQAGWLFYHMTGFIIC